MFITNRKQLPSSPVHVKEKREHVLIDGHAQFPQTAFVILYCGTHNLFPAAGCTMDDVLTTRLIHKFQNKMLHVMAPRTNDVVLFAETANRSIDGPDGVLMSPEGYVATAVVLFFVGLFGFFFNLVVIILVIKDKEVSNHNRPAVRFSITYMFQLRSPMNIILFNLICSDFSVSVLGNPFTLTASIFQHWIFGRTLCVMYGFFMSLLGTQYRFKCKFPRKTWLKRTLIEKLNNDFIVI